ncbi:MAG: diaminopimelate epimerase [Firmicutes bacterium]|nr:diaminopimelate epimerase [Bacillota bacterium]
MTENSVAKYHALGNDYIVVDPKYLTMNMTEDNIRMLCDRNFGVGSDGILYGPLTETPSFEVRIFNPDGSEAEKSGNGLRIFAKYLFDAGYLDGRTEFDILTKGGLAHSTLLHKRAELVEVDMGIPSFKSRDIPVNGEARDVVAEEIHLGGTPFRMTCVSVGNPHCVIVVDRATKALAQTLGPIVVDHALFPNRINLQLIEVLSRNAIKIEIWERGAGYTLASGSSSCAAAAAAHRLGLTDNHITVMMPGGELDIRIDEGGHIFMRGSVAAVFEARLSQALSYAMRV